MSRPLDWFVVAISLVFLYFGRPSDTGVVPTQKAPAISRPEATELLVREAAAERRARTAQRTLAAANLPPEATFVEGGLPLTADGRLSPIARNPEYRIGGDPRVWAAMLEDAAPADRRF